MRVVRVWYAFSSTCEADLLTRKEAIFSKSLDTRGCHVSQVTLVWQKQLPLQLPVAGRPSIEGTFSSSSASLVTVACTVPRSSLTAPRYFQGDLHGRT